MIFSFDPWRVLLEGHYPIKAWLAGELTFKVWQKELDGYNSKQIMLKYFVRWKNAVEERKWKTTTVSLQDATYLKQILLNPSSRAAREVTANLIQRLVYHFLFT